jgi:hypothetical protein
VQDNGAPSAGQAHAAGRDDERAGRERHARWQTSKTVECELVRVDDVIPRDADVSLLKADVEGAELSVFRGARELLTRCSPTIVCEINPWYLDGYGLAVEDLVGYLAELGYEPYRFVGGRLHPTRTEEIDEANYVFVHPDRRERFSTILGERP